MVDTKASVTLYELPGCADLGTEFMCVCVLSECKPELRQHRCRYHHKFVGAGHPSIFALQLPVPFLQAVFPVSYTHLTLPTIYSV